MRTYGVIETGLGWVGLMRSEIGLCASTLPRGDAVIAMIELDPAAGDLAADEDAFADAAAVIRSQLAGKAAKLAESLDLARGTPFQQTVWRAIETIPFGETRSYGWVAEQIDRPRGAHAVGQAVARNPLPLLVPCHRVVAADGTLGGYGRGPDALPTKRSLLRCEGLRYEGPTLEQWRSGVLPDSHGSLRIPAQRAKNVLNTCRRAGACLPPRAQAGHDAPGRQGTRPCPTERLAGFRPQRSTQ